MEWRVPLLKQIKQISEVITLIIENPIYSVTGQIFIYIRGYLFPMFAILNVYKNIDRKDGMLLYLHSFKSLDYDGSFRCL